MATTNTTHRILPITITSAATPQNIGDSLGLDDTTFDKSPQCVHFSVQNNDGTGKSVYVQESASAAAADSTVVRDGDYYVEPPVTGTMYDLREYWIRATADGQKVIVKFKKA